MKKFLLFSLVAIMAVFALSACSDSGDDDNKPTVTNIDPTNLETLLGVYDLNVPAVPTSVGKLYLNVDTENEPGTLVFNMVADINITTDATTIELPISITRRVAISSPDIDAIISQMLMTSGIEIKDGRNISIMLDPFLFPEVAVAIGNLGPLAGAAGEMLAGGLSATKAADLAVDGGLGAGEAKFVATTNGTATAINAKTPMTVVVGVPTPVVVVTTPAYVVRPATTFESSDTGVATVDANGLLTPVDVGTTTINVTTEGVTPQTVSVTVVPNIIGVYNVTFFGSQVTNVRPVELVDAGTVFYISNDCAKAIELYGDLIGTGIEGDKNNCTSETQSTLLEGKIAIKFENDKYHIASRMQMKGGAVDFSAADKYQYTEYYPLDPTTLVGTGVKGWNYDEENNKPSAAATEFDTSPFSVGVLSDGNIDINMTLKDKVAMGGSLTVDAVTRVLATKESSTYTALENKVTADLTPTE